MKPVLGLSLLILALGACSSKPIKPPRLNEESAISSAIQPQMGDVYLLKGLFNVFSAGLKDIAENLREKGLRTGVYAGPKWQKLANQIVEDRKQGNPDSIVVISGHSYGADNSIRLARALEIQGVVVDALVLVDPTTPPEIPANVRRCVNIYRSKPSTDWMPWLRGVPVNAKNQSTLLINRDLRLVADETGLKEEINHFNIEDNPAIQEMVVEEILAVFEQKQAGVALARPDSGEQRVH